MAAYLSGLNAPAAKPAPAGAPGVGASAVSSSVGQVGGAPVAASDPMSQLVQMRQISTGGPVSDAAAGLAARLANSPQTDLSQYGVDNYVPHGGGGAAGPVGSTPTGSLAQWITQAEQATGVNPSQWTNALNLIIQHESGGNPNAINNWDSNAAAGHPSEGLMQTIGPTFNSYVPASMRGARITDPVANIAAGIEYINSRYGGINNVPGVVAVSQGRPYVGY